jgi:hypothetical protein
MNNPDSLDTLWRETFTAKDSYTQKKLLLNPQYGGDGRTSARCDQFAPPVAAFPAHRTPVAVAFYTGAQFPARYRDDAFIAFHDSWNRNPAPQDGYNATFQAFAGGRPAGPAEAFAEGFAGRASSTAKRGESGESSTVAPIRRITGLIDGLNLTLVSYIVIYCRANCGGV